MISFSKETESKKKFFWGGREGRGVDERTDEQAQTNFPLQLLRSWGLWP